MVLLLGMTIQDWLNQDNRLYENGVMLYKRHGSSNVLLTLFESGENSMTRKKLLNELRAIATPQVIEKPKPPTPIPTPVKQKSVDTVDTDKYQTILDLKAHAFKEMAAAHAQLTKLKTKAERKEACKLIMLLDLQVDDYWEQLDHFDAYGTWPVQEDEVSIKTIRDVVQLSKNIPTYMTKINAKLKKENITVDEMAELHRQKDKWTLITQRIEKILDEPISV